MQQKVVRDVSGGRSHAARLSSNPKVKAASEQRLGRRESGKLGFPAFNV